MAQHAQGHASVIRASLPPHSRARHHHHQLPGIRLNPANDVRADRKRLLNRPWRTQTTSTARPMSPTMNAEPAQIELPRESKQRAEPGHD